MRAEAPHAVVAPHESPPGLACRSADAALVRDLTGADKTSETEQAGARDQIQSRQAGPCPSIVRRTADPCGDHNRAAKKGPIAPLRGSREVVDAPRIAPT